jgi:hypothetical protein
MAMISKLAAPITDVMTPTPPIAAARRKSFSIALEKSGSIGMANTVFWKTLRAKSIA